MNPALYLIDTSGLFRILQDKLRQAWADQLAAGMIATCPIVELEFLYSARSLADRLEKRRLLREVFGWVAMSDRAYERADEVQQLLTETGRHRSAGPVDLLIAATAEREGLIVLCDDHDFQTVASVTGQPVKLVAGLLVRPGESGGCYACESHAAMHLHLPRNQTLQDFPGRSTVATTVWSSDARIIPGISAPTITSTRRRVNASGPGGRKRDSHDILLLSPCWLSRRRGAAARAIRAAAYPHRTANPVKRGQRVRDARCPVPQGHARAGRQVMGQVSADRGRQQAGRQDDHPARHPRQYRSAPASSPNGGCFALARCCQLRVMTELDDDTPVTGAAAET